MPRVITLARAVVVLLAVSASVAACGSSEKDEFGDGGSGAGGGNSAAGGSSATRGGSNATGASGSVVNLGGAQAVAGGGGLSSECAGEVTTGKLLPLDMFLMLDTSASMLELTTDDTDKWTAVKQAMVAFLNAPGSAGLGVGIQYFPLLKPGTPATCTNNNQCGNNGPCFLKLCWGGLDSDFVAACETDAQCRVSALEDYGPCVSFGFCSADPSYICRNPGGQCGSDDTGVNLGTCTADPGECINGTLCDVSAYAAPAVEIATLPGAAGALVASINARMPNGHTPTGPALQGALQQAQRWANSHPDHTVVTVLATDGLPTECTPLEIADISTLAQNGARANPAIRTFVIGVFGNEVDDLTASTNLGSIARAGGTDRAYIVDTAQDVGQQFLDALNAIRGSSLTCEFKIPQPTTGEMLDYRQVNVLFTEGATTTPLFYVGATEAACAGAAGWFYDSDPAVKSPTKIIACPVSCAKIAGSQAGAVKIQLGCATVPR